MSEIFKVKAHIEDEYAQPTTWQNPSLLQKLKEEKNHVF